MKNYFGIFGTLSLGLFIFPHLITSEDVSFSDIKEQHFVGNALGGVFSFDDTRSSAIHGKHMTYIECFFQGSSIQYFNVTYNDHCPRTSEIFSTHGNSASIGQYNLLEIKDGDYVIAFRAQSCRVGSDVRLCYLSLLTKAGQTDPNTEDPGVPYGSGSLYRTRLECGQLSARPVNDWTWQNVNGEYHAVKYFYGSANRAGLHSLGIWHGPYNIGHTC